MALMGQGLLVLETPWEDDLGSAVSVGPFLQGLGAMLNIKVACQRINSKLDLKHYLEKFSQRQNEYSYCYVGSHGTKGRLGILLGDVNAATIGRACRGSEGRGFVVGACSFGNRATATAFLEKTHAAFVAGYAKGVPWEESMLTDLVFLTYLIGGRCRRRTSDGQSQLVTQKNGDFPVERSRDPVKVAGWVYQDFPLAHILGFVVHRRVKRNGRWRVETSTP